MGRETILRGKRYERVRPKSSSRSFFKSSLRQQRGATLLELVLTLAIIAMIASVAIPEKRPSEEYALSVTIAALADLIRFARERSAFTGVPHGVEVDAENQQIRLFRVDAQSSPAKLVYDVIDPMSKRSYVLDFSVGAHSAIYLTGLRVSVPSACNQPSAFVFDQAGVVRCPNEVSKRFNKLAIELKSTARSEEVQIDSYTGRVSLP